MSLVHNATGAAECVAGVVALQAQSSEAPCPAAASRYLVTGADLRTTVFCPSNSQAVFSFLRAEGSSKIQARMEQQPLALLTAGPSARPRRRASTCAIQSANQASGWDLKPSLKDNPSPEPQLDDIKEVEG